MQNTIVQVFHYLFRLMAASACAAIALVSSQSVLAQVNTPGCVPVEQRAGREVGCYILVTEKLGRLPQEEVFWVLYNYPNRDAAEAAKRSGDTVFESVGKTWLAHVGPRGWEAHGGERVAEIGPLNIDTSANHNAVYMEAVFTPGMRANIHRHSGPEAWYTVAGETCLETPERTYIGRAGGPPVIVPAGPPMALTATGNQMRKAVVLILHDASRPHMTLATDWAPKGQCDQYLSK